MNTPPSPFQDIATALASEGWCVAPDFLSITQTQALADECRALHAAQRLTPARVGALRTATPLRGDSTHCSKCSPIASTRFG
jgi:SM-20-related protein